MKALRGRVFTLDGIKERVVCFSEYIEKIVEIDNYHGEVEAFEGLLIPGFIELHVHGLKGIDTMDGNLKELSKALLKDGVTGFLATTMTAPLDELDELFQSFRKEKVENFLGIHLEGPFLNPKKSGAQETKSFQLPNIDFVKRNLDLIKVVSFAPELDPELTFIHALKDDVILSIAHSDATYDECVRAIRGGVKHVSHLFNAMRGLHHREPGVVGAALTEDVSVEVIPDGIHVHPKIIELVAKVKNDKLVFITDSMRARGLSDGTYLLGGREVTVEGRLAHRDGVISGSIVSPLDVIHFLQKETTLPLESILRSLTSIPAKVLGIDDREGSIVEGHYSNFVILKDERIDRVYFRGQRV
ncbi:N-acetylglucosamine-6-phosphate deacetylase [Guggenheimella bovis]